MRTALIVVSGLLASSAAWAQTQPTSATAATYHVFPQFADGRFSDGTYYRTTLMISNPNATSGTTCTVQLRGLSVPGFQLMYTVEAGGSVIAPTSGTTNFQSGYATLQCSERVEAQLLYSYYGPNGIKLSEATVFSSPPAPTVKVWAWPGQFGNSRLGLAIANDTDQTVSYRVSVGPASGSVMLGPRSSVARFINEIVSGIGSSLFYTVEIASTNSTVSAIGLNFTGSVFTTIPQSIWSSVGPTADTFHVFPQFADGRFGDGSFYRTARVYLNPNTAATADCVTRLYGGVTINGSNVINGSLEAGLSVISVSGPQQAGPGTQPLQSGYATTSCSARVYAAAVYSYYSATGVKLAEATVFSSPSAQRVQILADTREGARVGLAIANDTDQPDTYTITMYDPNRNVVGTATQALAGRSSVARFLDELVTLPANYYGQVIVSAGTGTASIIGLRFTGNVFTTIPETIR